jgi:tetratricopeptide (TPR) repeat protein
VGMGGLLDRMRGALGTRTPSASELFRQADRLRHEGRSEEAALLVQEGLRLSPTSSAGHLLAGYLHLGARNVERARTSFRTVLALDHDHPRALLGLARIAIEAGDPATARPFLERALQYHTDFPEARALEEMLASWTPDASDSGPATEPAPGHAGVALPEGARDSILARLDGTVMFARCDDGRQAMVAQHVVQVARIATATLMRAGLGPLHQGVVDGANESTYLQADAGLVLAVSLPAATPVPDGLDCLGTLWADTVPAHD